MEWKKVLAKILFPATWIIIISDIFSTVALIYVFIKDLEESVQAVIIYVIAFYSLTIFILACIKTFPVYYKNLKVKVYDNQYANRYFTDDVFKTYITLYRSFIINLLYIAVNVVSAIVYSTYWFGIFAIYYTVMAIMQFLLVQYVKKSEIGENRYGELKRSRFCASMLMTVNIILSGVVLMMLYKGRGFEYKGFLIYVMAMYTFYITVSAIVNLIKYRKYNSPVMSVSKMVKLTSALFSMLFLETAMFSQFGQDTSQEVKKIMIMSTGAGISVIVVVMSMYVIINTTKEIQIIKRNGD